MKVVRTKFDIIIIRVVEKRSLKPLQKKPQKLRRRWCQKKYLYIGDPQCSVWSIWAKSEDKDSSRMEQEEQSYEYVIWNCR